MKKLFHFDDPVNDSKANKWGKDFGSLFAGGAVAGMKAAIQGAGLTDNTRVSVQLTGPMTINHPMDAETIGDQIARVIDRRLNVRTSRRS